MARVSEALFSSAVSGTEYKSKVYIYLMAFFRSAWFAINHWPQRMTITLARSFAPHPPTDLPLAPFLLHLSIIILIPSPPPPAAAAAAIISGRFDGGGWLLLLLYVDLFYAEPKCPSISDRNIFVAAPPLGCSLLFDPSTLASPSEED